MAQRLKILMSSGSKKGTQIYFHFLSKSPDKRIPSRFSNGAPMERDTRLQGIFTYIFFSNAQRKERPSMFPTSEGPMETDAHSRALLNIFFGVPSRGAPSRSPLGKGCPVPTALPPSLITQSPGVRAPSSFQIDVRIRSISLHIFQGPQ